MCRLFGQYAHPGFDHSSPLCSARNALRFQSHKHPHGWGIGWYEGGRPVLRRGLLPAHADDSFADAAASACSAVVLAHVRDASIGRVSTENTHPFEHGRWLFAHNGTVARFKRQRSVREALLAEIDPDLRDEVRGDTDSERCFYVFLSKLRGIASLEEPSLASVARALEETTLTVRRIADGRSRKPSTLNFLVSDGRVLAASRRGRTLFAAAGAGPAHAYVVASERIGAALWEEVPEGGVVATEDGVRAYSSPAIGSSRG